MPFIQVYNNYSAPPTRVSHVYATNSEAFVYGEAVKLVSGRWTKASGTDVPAGYANQSLAAGTDQILDVIMFTEGDVYECAYTGTPAGGFVIGANAVGLATSGLTVDSAVVAGGAVVILDITPTTKIAKVKIKSRQLS